MKSNYWFISRKIKQKREETEQYITSQCTFRPNITKYRSNSRKNSNNSSKISLNKSGNRCHDLYELSKNSAKKHDLTTDDYLYEKDKSEYTFIPKITKSKVTSSIPAMDPLIKETIERLKRGREERDRVKKKTERGIYDSQMRFDVELNKYKSIGEEYSKCDKSKESNSINSEEIKNNLSPDKWKENKEEKLYIDVNLGENMERIIVHRGDTAAGLAHEFSANHSKNYI